MLTCKKEEGNYQMPNRVIRQGILDSEPVNKLSWASEVFYRRLMSVADDYGRYDGRPIILRTSLYALKINQVSEADIVKWMNECSEAGLISFYEVDGKPYLEIENFGQTIRIKKEKYPACTTSAKHPPSTGMYGKKPIQSETGVGIAPTFFFKVRSFPVMEKLSEYIPRNFGIFLDQWQMRNDKNKTSTKLVLADMDVSYAGYSFTDENHIQKSFLYTFDKKIKDNLNSTPKITRTRI